MCSVIVASSVNVTRRTTARTSVKFYAARDKLYRIAVCILLARSSKRNVRCFCYPKSSIDISSRTALYDSSWNRSQQPTFFRRLATENSVLFFPLNVITWDLLLLFILFFLVECCVLLTRA